MNGAKHSASARSAKLSRSVEARKILTRHFGFREGAVNTYFTQASQREGLKVIEIENAVIRLACDFF